MEIFEEKRMNGGDLVFSEGSMFFAGFEKKNIQMDNLSLRLFVLNISTDDCFLNPGSFDQIAQPSFNASANMGTSLSCINSLALGSNSSNKFLGIIFSDLTNEISIVRNCSEFILAYFNISDAFFFNSSIVYSGVYNDAPKKSELIIINLTGLSLKNDINILVSTTNSIFYRPSCLYLFQTPSLILSPILRQSSSVNSEFSSILSSFFNNNSRFTLSVKNLRTSSDQFVSGIESSFFFNSSDIDNVKFGIFEPTQYSVYYLKDVLIYKSFDSGTLRSDFIEENKDGAKDFGFIIENKILLSKITSGAIQLLVLVGIKYDKFFKYLGGNDETHT